MDAYEWIQWTARKLYRIHSKKQNFVNNVCDDDKLRSKITYSEDRNKFFRFFSDFAVSYACVLSANTKIQIDV